MADVNMKLATAARIGSILVHVEEGLGATGHPFDWQAVESLMSDPAVQTWLDGLRAIGLLPVKRA